MNNQNPQSDQTPYTCVFHPDLAAEWVCQRCKTLYCKECVVHKSLAKIVAHICPNDRCRARCVPVKVDEITGRMEYKEEPKPEVKTKRPGEPGSETLAKRILTRYYIALAMPALTFLVYDIFLKIQGRTPLFWLFIVWAGLIFLMSGRQFWAYVFVSTISFFHVAWCLYRILSQAQYKNDIPTLNWISFGLWILTFLVLALSHPEFTD